jgi:hypothetical protein
VLGGVAGTLSACAATPVTLGAAGVFCVGMGASTLLMAGGAVASYPKVEAECRRQQAQR